MQCQFGFFFAVFIVHSVLFFFIRTMFDVTFLSCEWIITTTTKRVKEKNIDFKWSENVVVCRHRFVHITHKVPHQFIQLCVTHKLTTHFEMFLRFLIRKRATIIDKWIVSWSFIKWNKLMMWWFFVCLLRDWHNQHTFHFFFVPPLLKSSVFFLYIIIIKVNSSLFRIMIITWGPNANRDMQAITSIEMHCFFPSTVSWRWFLYLLSTKRLGLCWNWPSFFRKCTFWWAWKVALSIYKFVCQFQLFYFLLKYSTRIVQHWQSNRLHKIFEIWVSVCINNLVIHVGIHDDAFTLI